MTKRQLQREWKKIAIETRKRSRIGKHLDDKNISHLGDLFLFAQVLLDKIEAGENNDFNSIVYRKVINFYCAQMKNYV